MKFLRPFEGSMLDKGPWSQRALRYRGCSQPRTDVILTQYIEIDGRTETLNLQRGNVRLTLFSPLLPLSNLDRLHTTPCTATNNKLHPPKTIVSITTSSTCRKTFTEFQLSHPSHIHCSPSRHHIPLWSVQPLYVHTHTRLPFPR
jgi:hypothetical protein